MTSITPNVGFLDRMVRGLLAIDLLAACYISLIDGPSSILFYVIAFFFTLTGLSGYCPVYAALGRNTRHRTEP